MKRWISTKAVAVFAVSVTQGGLEAAVTLVTLSGQKSVTMTHVGSDTLFLESSSLFFSFSIIGDDSPVIGRAPGRVGEIAISSGGVFPISSTVVSVDYYDVQATVALDNADTNFNYLKMDLDGNGVYETIVELDFGTDLSSFDDDYITRYLYDNDGGGLIVPQLSNFIPEPSAIALSMIALFGFSRRRTR
jgi:hypothetical protein